MNIFDFAIKMEQQGMDFYERLAAATDHPGLRTIFTRLAQDEEKHHAIFMALKGGRPAMPMEESTALDSARDVFAELLAGTHRDNTVQGDLESYRFAMKIEAESFRLYEDAATQEKNPSTRTLLLRIANEEHNHFNILENLYRFVNAPNEYLAWGEFSNLAEFRNFGRSVDN